MESLRQTFEHELNKGTKSFRDMQIMDFDLNYCHICDTYSCVAHNLDDSNNYSLQRIRRPFYLSDKLEDALAELEDR